MRFACWVQRPQTHTRNVSYLLLCHCNNGRTNAPECYVTRTLPVLLFSQCTALIVSALNGFFSQCIWNFVHKVLARCVVSYGCSPIAQVDYSLQCLLHPCCPVFQQQEWDRTCRSDCESSWCCNLPELQLSLTWHSGAQCVAAVCAGIARTYTSYYWCVVFWPVCACNCACQHALPYALHARPS